MTTTSWRLAVIAICLIASASALFADEPKPCLPALCQQLKSRCVVAPYCPKSAPCAPCYALSVDCTVYCPKESPPCESYCLEWCTSIYCKKCEPCCYPLDPCERQVWHTLCPAPCTFQPGASLEMAMIGKRVAF